MAEARNPSLSPLAALVRKHDSDRFATALFAPAEQREDLFVLYAFNYELAKVRESVHEPMMGRIRLQWWRDVIAEIAAGHLSRSHEVAGPLSRTIRKHCLSCSTFERMIAARELDLLPDPPAQFADFEAYADATGGSLNAMALRVLEIKNNKRAAIRAAHQIGIAYAMTGLLRAIPFHARFGRSFIPMELDPKRHALGGKVTDTLRSAVATIAKMAHERLAKARALRDEVPPSAAPVLLPTVITERWLLQLERADYDPFAVRVARPDPWRGARLYIAAWRGFF